MSSNFGASLSPLPGPIGEAFTSWLAELPPAEHKAIAKAASALGPLFTAAPYLADLANRHSTWLAETLLGDPETSRVAILDFLRALPHNSIDETARDMRHAKARLALLAGIAETCGVWTTAKTTEAVSDLADSALEAGLTALVREAVDKGDLRDNDAPITPKNCGLAVFALGKHGGRELNYSSDIDIVVFFDAHTNLLTNPSEATKIYSRIVRNLVGLMEERTEHGYVFRTDLRLRPDPGSMPLAIPLESALTYYEGRGQNWERAAWIKARPCAGDKRVAENFLDELAPFIWRKHLDFATIADIQAMKRQINISRDVGAARVAGHNVKLGRGGIREIEFFTQTQQLIAGGRDPNLRQRPTCLALAALGEAGWITEEAAEELTKTYWFLRAVENRLQMLRDEQTHTMPQTDEGVAIIASMMQRSPENFETDYRAALASVMSYYAELFTEGESLASDMGDLVFTGTDDDPGTVETLTGLGFANPAKASAIIRKWHYGSYPATRAAASRAHLTELVPSLLVSLSALGNADEALEKFDHFVSRFPTGVQLFSLLRNHPELCRLLAAFMASAPRLAEAVIHRAHVMDGLIDPAFAEGVSSTEILVEKVGQFLDEARSFEERIDRARIIGQEQKFLISAGFASATVDAARAGKQFTSLAETLLGRLFASVQAEFAIRHGTIPGASIALLGFGKMASREMTATSDLDFILLYDVPSGDGTSDGEKPLAAAPYFTRLTQRLVAALSAPTAEGVLYETDMRLRPSGNAGPLATPISSFIAYQKQKAWTWEHLALTRARAVGGDPAAITRVEAVIAEVLAQPRDAAETIENVRHMRARMVRERKSRHLFDLKLAAGGLIDIEFIAQSAQLLAGAKINLPQAPIADVLKRMGEVELLEQAPRLVEIHGLYTTILQAMSICLLKPFADNGWPSGFRDLLLDLTNYPDFERLTLDLTSMQKEVLAISEEWYTQAERL